MNVLELRHDPALLGSLYQGDSWQASDTFLAVMDGLALTREQFEIYRECTERTKAPTEPFKIVLGLWGRRGGKEEAVRTKVIHHACIVDHSASLTRGERGVIPIITADRAQSKVTFDRICGAFEVSPMLQQLVERQTRESIHLNNGISPMVKTGSYRTLRGISSPFIVINEAAFLRNDDGSANPDLEIYRAALPSLLSFPKSQILILSTPYARRGLVYSLFSKHWAKDDPRVLVWRAPSLRMNPTLDARSIQEAREEDPEAAASEYDCAWRSDVESFATIEAATACTVSGRFEIPPRQGERPVGFCDPSGGSADSFTLAIATYDRATSKAVLACVRERKPPFSPDATVKEFSETLKSYGLSTVHGDKYAGLWPRERFAKYGVSYQVSDKTKSEIYTSFLPLLNAARVELLDIPRLRSQLLGLDRRIPRGGGRANVDHGPGGRDDVINSAAGALVLAAERFGRRRSGTVSQLLWG